MKSSGCHGDLYRRALRRSRTAYKRMATRVVAIGLDRRGTPIDIAINRPTGSRSHAEAIVVSRSPRSLTTILLYRFGRSGIPRPIEPCEACQKLLDKYGIKVQSMT